MNISLKNWKLIFILFLTLSPLISVGQVQEDKHWCRLNCNPTINKENARVIADLMENDSIQNSLDTSIVKRFPIRFVFVKEENFIPNDTTKKALDLVLDQLNEAFINVGFIFENEKMEVLNSPIKLEELSQNHFELYDGFSKANDEKGIITVYILNHKNEFCTITNNSISCSRIGGFSYILSSRNNNIVMSELDLRDPKIVAHEFGHFFGLYHTFEENLFGKDNFNPDECHTTGDLVCDTPPDPGTVFELYVNYSTCEMIGFKDPNGNEYQPILENYMSYYKPCYLKKYSFSKEQEMLMKLAGQLPIRENLSRKEE